jgi:hypothetical protein
LRACWRIIFRLGTWRWKVVRGIDDHRMNQILVMIDDQ